jgi:hypothetical protein
MTPPKSVVGGVSPRSFIKPLSKTTLEKEKQYEPRFGTLGFRYGLRHNQFFSIRGQLR